MSPDASSADRQLIRQRPRVTVIVPVKDGLDRLQICLQALLAQDYPVDRYEVIVVDNGSSTSPAGVIPEDTRVTLLTEPTPGSYRARNVGLARASGEIIAFTDADCVPAVDWLTEATECLIRDPSIDMIGGQVELAYEHGAPLTGPEWVEFVEGFPQQRYVRNGFAVTANMVTRRSVFDRVGLFDAELLSGGDAEWGRRVRDSGGHQHFAASVVVKHPARESWPELREKTARTTAGVVRRTRKGGRPRVAVARLLLGQLVRSAMLPLRTWREQKLPARRPRLKYLGTRWRVDAVIVGVLLRALLPDSLATGPVAAIYSKGGRGTRRPR